MGKLPELPREAVIEYWQLVRAALVAGGLSKRAAATAVRVYREWMRPAGWALDNTDPEESAKYAMKYAAWIRKEQEQSTTKQKAARTNRASDPPGFARTRRGHVRNSISRGVGGERRQSTRHLGRVELPPALNPLPVDIEPVGGELADHLLPLGVALPVVRVV